MKMPSQFVIGIGCSAGGVSALQKILDSLNAKLRASVIVVQHIAKDWTTDLIAVYGRNTGLTVKEIEDKMPLETETVYFAPANYHVLLEKDGHFALSVDEKLHYSRPSIDIFFESLSHLGSDRKIMGILLTGANEDGSQGLKKIQLAGGFTIVQNPEESEFPQMPEAALKLIKPSEVLSLDQIADKIHQRLELTFESQN